MHEFESQVEQIMKAAQRDLHANIPRLGAAWPHRLKIQHLSVCLLLLVPLHRWRAELGRQFAVEDWGDLSRVSEIAKGSFQLARHRGPRGIDQSG